MSSKKLTREDGQKVLIDGPGPDGDTWTLRIAIGDCEARPVMQFCTARGHSAESKAHGAFELVACAPNIVVYSLWRES